MLVCQATNAMAQATQVNSPLCVQGHVQSHKRGYMSSKNLLNLSRFLVLAVILITSLALLFPVSMVKAESTVNFPDANLQAAIREAIPKPSGDIYESDLIGPTHVLTALLAESQGIEDLTGLEHCTALTTLMLHGNRAHDLTPLSGLTGLTTLGLISNQVSDISPLSGLTNLQRLGLEGNQIRNLTPLSGLTNLWYLRLSANKLDDIAPLSGLTKMQSLFLVGNQTDNLTPLSGLTALTGLWVNDNRIVDLAPLSGLTNLRQLGLGGNQIVDLTPLSGLTGLTQLSLRSNQIVDLTPLSGLTSLTQLDLDINQIGNLTSLSGLVNLTELSLNNNQTSDLTPLSGLTSLSELRLEGNLIRNIQPLVNNAGMASRDVVVLRNNPLNANTVNTCIPALQGRGVTVSWDPPVSQSPRQPTNVSPRGRATGISLTPTLTSSTFSDPDASNSHAASQWQVTTTPGDYSSPVFDSSTDNSSLTSNAVLSLKHSTTYYWRVAHQDNHGHWSAWSAETSFTTGPRIPIWLWVVIGIAAVLAVSALGVTVLLVRRRFARR
jgi:Leucine-rich repeat (LRR) protein